jgi:copper homeostasis protein
MLLEACVDSCEAALAAELGGADRIELNSALPLDGLTPSPGLFLRTRQTIRLPLIAMARPRGGGFHYSGDDWDTLLADAKWLIEHGADGIAFGCLDGRGNVDLERCRQMRRLSAHIELVFHKAFDVVSDWRVSLDRLIEAGINRVMTSGQHPTAIEGLERLAEIQVATGGRIELLPAGGIRRANCLEIVDTAAVEQLHSSFRLSPDASPEEIRSEIEATRQILPN